MKNVRAHPERIALTNELHARPVAQVAAPAQVSHFAFLAGEDGAAAARAHLLAVCDHHGVAQPSPEATHFLADLGQVRLKWERHTEFLTYTLLRDGAHDPFEKPPAALMPEGWLDEAPGELLVAVHVALEAGEAAVRVAERLADYFVMDSLCSSMVAGGRAQIWTDFRIHEDGFSRFLVQDLRLTPQQTARLVQRLLEIETYRTVALLALPLARRTGPRITRIDQALVELTAGMDELHSLGDERALLDRLTNLSKEIESVSATSSYRFSAASAYYAVTKSRIGELREQRAEGHQTVHEFMERRLAPAMRTCESVAERLQVLAERASRMSNLLRTRVDVTLEGQNRDLLASMDRRARQQLRLQQTVEGLSVAAITYYLVSLVGYLLEATSQTGLRLDADLGRAVAIPVIAVLVWFGLKRVRRKLAAEKKPEPGRS